MTLEIWLAIALFLSVMLNVFLAWFAREQSQRLTFISQNLNDLLEIISNYKEHLRKVYSLEMFYGDETLKYLMEHTNAVVQLLETEYSQIINITDPIEVLEYAEENEEEERKDVLYGGTRTSDT
jgi:DNA-binding PadR family transcriptional regulator